MDIVKFTDKTWQEIPDQDNPAMQRQMYSDGYRRPDESIIIFRGTFIGITDGGFVVAHIPVNSDITQLGVFWTLKNAEAFADLVSNSESKD